MSWTADKIAAMRAAVREEVAAIAAEKTGGRA